jgi:hypothetical protein
MSSDSTSFDLGVNYPWLRYAEDFGGTPAGHCGVSLPETNARVAADFSRIRDCGASVVRWFLFGDGRGGFICRDGIPLEPDSYLLEDVAAALQVAERSGLRICFSLIDYLWLQTLSPTKGSVHRDVLHFSASRQAFLENVLIPLFREFRGHPSLFAWEIANEPEWAIREFHRVRAAKMRIADFRAFAGELVRSVHEFAEVPATLGSARLMWLRAWSALNLDLYQAHYYPSCEADMGADLSKQLAALPNLDKPLWLGELPACDPTNSNYSLLAALNACRNAHLSGAAAWRWTAPEPTASDAGIGCVEPADLRRWSKSGFATAHSA